MAVGLEQVKELRERTGVSVMECKKALEEAEGDIEKALVLLRKKSAQTTDKKSDRELGAGVVAAYIHNSKDVGTLIALSSETDFVAKNPEFETLAYDIAMHAAATAPQFINRDDVTEEDTKAAQDVFEGEAADKPEEVRAKIVAGKMDSYLKEKVLMEQDYIKDPSVTIKDMLQSATQKFGERIEITEIARFSTRG